MPTFEEAFGLKDLAKGKRRKKYKSPNIKVTNLLTGKSLVVRNKVDAAVMAGLAYHTLAMQLKEDVRRVVLGDFSFEFEEEDPRSYRSVEILVEEELLLAYYRTMFRKGFSRSYAKMLIDDEIAKFLAKFVEQHGEKVTPIEELET